MNKLSLVLSSLLLSTAILTNAVASRGGSDDELQDDPARAEPRSNLFANKPDDQAIYMNNSLQASPQCLLSV